MSEFVFKTLKSKSNVDYQASYGNTFDNPEIAQKHNLGERTVMYYRKAGDLGWVKWTKDKGEGFVKWLEEN